MIWNWTCPKCDITLHRDFFPGILSEEEQKTFDEKVVKWLNDAIENHLKTHSSRGKANE